MSELRKTFKFRLYHSDKDWYLHNTIDVCADIWNHCLALQKRYYKIFGKYISEYSLKKHIAKLRRKNELWQLVGSQAVQEIIERLDKAYQRFFSWVKTRKGKRVNPPKFKKVRNYSSFTLKQSGWKIQEEKNKIKIGKKIFKMVWTRPILGTIKTVTIKRDSLGKLWICFSVIQELDQETSRAGNAVGCDFGLKQFLTLSDGSIIDSPEFFKESLQDIRSLSKELSRRKRGSKNWKRTLYKLKKAYIKISNRRLDWCFKLANDLLSKFDFVCIEDLDLDSMKSKWGRKISDLVYCKFVNILSHLAKCQGKTVLKVGKYFPSTQTCSSCGNKQKMDLTQRVYSCKCGLSLDRDLNAAKNILTEGIRLCGDDVRLINFSNCL